MHANTLRARAKQAVARHGPGLLGIGTTTPRGRSLTCWITAE